MASSKATSSTQVPRAHHFELVDLMQLQINVTGCSSGRNARIGLQLKNCTTTWILHWGYLYCGDRTGSFLWIILQRQRLTCKAQCRHYLGRDICTLTDFATMYGPSSYRMLYLRVRIAKRMLAG